MTSSADLQRWDPWTPLPASSLAPASPVAAAWLGERLYVFGITDTRKPPLSSVVVVNFSLDGLNWSGWRQPQTTTPYQPGTALAVAGTGDHLYAFAANAGAAGPAQVPVH